MKFVNVVIAVLVLTVQLGSCRLKIHWPESLAGEYYSPHYVTLGKQPPYEFVDQKIVHQVFGVGHNGCEKLSINATGVIMIVHSGLIDAIEADSL